MKKCIPVLFIALSLVLFACSMGDDEEIIIIQEFPSALHGAWTSAVSSGEVEKYIISNYYINTTIKTDTVPFTLFYQLARIERLYNISELGNSWRVEVIPYYNGPNKHMVFHLKDNNSKLIVIKENGTEIVYSRL